MKTIKSLIIRDRYNNTERRVIKAAFNYVDDINPKNKSRHVSLLMFKGEVIQGGVNNEKAFFDYRPLGFNSIHSEYACIKKFLRFNPASQIKYFTLWNVRINRYNEIVNSRPCRRCSYLLQLFEPKRVFFSDESGRFQQWQN